MFKTVTVSMLSLALLAACGKNQRQTKMLSLTNAGPTSIVVLGAKRDQEFLKEATELGVSVQGSQILRLVGHSSAINQLHIPADQEIEYIEDAPIQAIAPKSFSYKPESLYLAQKDFGLLEFWKKYPQADGRGVIVGVIDDGISPQQFGFQRTTTGERKFLVKGSQSSLSTYELTLIEGEHYSATIKEEKPFDLNFDENFETFKATVSLDGSEVCLDLNVDDSFSEKECQGVFSKTGNWFELPKEPSLSVLVEVDLENKKLQIFQAEKMVTLMEKVSPVL